MISPHTPPGTSIICVDARHTSEFASNKSMVFLGGMDGLCEGKRYTLARIERRSIAASGFVAVLAEICRGERMPGFDLGRFRLPVTIDSLTAVPSEAPADLDRRTAPVSPRKRVRA